MLACAPFVPVVTVPQLKLFSAFASVRATPDPGVSAKTVTVSPDATATKRSRAILLRLRLIAAARLVALVATVVDTSKFNPVFEVEDDVKVRVNAVPPVGVMVMDVVAPVCGSPVKVPITLARVFPVDALMGNTAKSEVQLGGAFTSKLYLAGDMPCATPPAPKEMAQSFFILRLACFRSFPCTKPECIRPESAGAFPCRSHSA